MWLVIFIDLIFLNIELFGIYSFWHLISPAGVRYLSVNEVILCWNVTFLLSVLLVNPIAQNRLSRPEQVAARVFKTGLLQQLLFISSIAFLGSKLLTVPLALAQVAITLQPGVGAHFQVNVYNDCDSKTLPADDELWTILSRGDASRNRAKNSSGMGLAIEPMINMGTHKVFIDADDPYGWEVYTEDGMPSAQWEKTIAITENGPEVITE